MIILRHAQYVLFNVWFQNVMSIHHSEGPPPGSMQLQDKETCESCVQKLCCIGTDLIYAIIPT